MDEKPKRLQEPILNRLGLSLIGVISISSAIAAMALFGHFYRIHGDPIEGRSFAFGTFAVNSMIYIFAYRSMRRSLFHSGSLMRNKPLIAAVAGGLLLAFGAFVVAPIRNLLGIVPLELQQWGIIFGVALSLLTVVEIGKLLSNYRRRVPVVQRVGD